MSKPEEAEDYECLYCGALLPETETRHWEECPKHPAGIEVRRLRTLLDSARSALMRPSEMALVEQAADICQEAGMPVLAARIRALVA